MGLGFRVGTTQGTVENQLQTKAGNDRNLCVFERWYRGLFDPKWIVVYCATAFHGL